MSFPAARNRTWELQYLTAACYYSRSSNMPVSRHLPLAKPRYQTRYNGEDERTVTATGRQKSGEVLLNGCQHAVNRGQC